MPPKNEVTKSAYSIKPRQSATERRAAQIAVAATKQAELKAEAAQRRLARESRDAHSPAPRARDTGAARRPRAR